MNTVKDWVKMQVQTQEYIINTKQRGKWLRNTDEVFSYLQQNKQTPIKKENWWSSRHFTMSLLKQARHLILQSEKRIRELEALCNTDELTSLLNRRGFHSALEKELDRTNRHYSKGGLLIMIDLDNFKLINDKFGHDTGDKALKLVGKTLLSDVRKMDFAARLGGDEFILLFSDTTGKKALNRAEKIIKKLNNLSFIQNKTEIQVRASLGFVEYKNGDCLDNILRNADQQMYQDKNSKKDKIKALA